MTPVTLSSGEPTYAAPLSLTSLIEAACDRIAPAWPLDRLIAVNPYWGFVGSPIETAAAQLGAVSGSSMLMPRAWYRAQWHAGRFAERHVARAIAEADSARSVHEVVAALVHDEGPLTPWRLMTDVADADRDLVHAMSWSEFVTRNVSQICAAFFDEGQARWTPDRDGGLYPLWRDLSIHDRGPRLLMGIHGFRAAVAALPEEPRVLIAEALGALEVPVERQSEYLTALLLSVNGWASTCAFRRWDARLAGADDDQIAHLLAVRLAWELVLFRLGAPVAMHAGWRTAQRWWGRAALDAAAARADDWLLQGALEAAYQESLGNALTAAHTKIAPSSPTPTAQAVFCIDVRSEVMRRAVEHVAPAVQTLGFAGFFGLPIAYAPLAGAARAQLPGLLAPRLVVRDQGAMRDAAVAGAARSLADARAWRALGRVPASVFSFVEATGLASVVPLVRDALALGSRHGDVLRKPSTGWALRPELVRDADDGAPLGVGAQVSLAAAILRAMSLTSGFAPLLVLVGHGASTENNPLANGLHCGACGGQTGEVNARALAALLADPAVRAGLAAEGIDLGATHVVAGLHDTTTDDVTWHDIDHVPAFLTPAIELLAEQFADAGRLARRERAGALGLADASDAAIHRATRVRGRDWSEVRPEWGLAGNAAFVVAPRSRTRTIDLGGRAFLHEYRWEQDAGFATLEQILTAPMVVTHWINMQYFASTVDPERYGSGNKVLHNVVGGRVGVMEGAGGDLRIGLARQSLHDGQRAMHEPLRLAVFVEAPAYAIDAILGRHAMVRDLVEHRWLSLHRIEPSDGSIAQRRAGGWHDAVQ
ncbi:YbcC family protein [soil metagenome]